MSVSTDLETIDRLERENERLLTAVQFIAMHAYDDCEDLGCCVAAAEGALKDLREMR